MSGCKFFTVWTPKHKGDFVTTKAVKNGGKVIEGHWFQCDALSAALKLNKYNGDEGYYCVLVDNEGYAAKATRAQNRAAVVGTKVPMSIKLNPELHAWLLAQPESNISLIEAGLIRLKDGQ